MTEERASSLRSPATAWGGTRHHWLTPLWLTATAPTDAGRFAASILGVRQTSRPGTRTTTHEGQSNTVF
jgi:hypothetical protein